MFLENVVCYGYILNLPKYENVDFGGRRSKDIGEF